MKPKSLKPWIILLVLPFVLLIGTALAQLLVRFALTRAGDPAATGGGLGAVGTIINIISLVIGVVSVIMIMGTPVWVIMLVMASRHNKQLQEGTPQPPSQEPASDSQGNQSQQ